MRDESPLVTIVTPSFNQARFIGETIRSVLEQDYPRIEYVVIDGGSTDGTVDILREFGARHPERIRWVSERDQGQADAVNKGFRSAKGSIFGWVNSDDTLLPGAVSAAVSHFRNHSDHVMVYGEAQTIDQLGRVTGMYETEHPFDLSRLGKTCFICQPTVFLRSQVFRKVGLLRLDLQTCMDYDYWMRVGKQFPEGVGYTGKTLATTRLYPENKTFSLRRTVYAEIIKTIWRHFRYIPMEQVEALLSEELLFGETDLFDDRLWKEKFPVERFVLGLFGKLPSLRYSRINSLLGRERIALFRFLRRSIGLGWLLRPRALADSLEVLDGAPFEDGWVGYHCGFDVPVWANRLWVIGRYDWPRDEPLRLQASTGKDSLGSISTSRKGDFIWEIPLSDVGAGNKWFRYVDVVAARTFRPSVESESSDGRRLSFQLVKVGGRGSISVSDLFAGQVYPDGWVGGPFELDFFPNCSEGTLQVWGRHAWPMEEPLILKAFLQGRQIAAHTVEMKGNFAWSIPLPFRDFPGEAPVHLELRSNRTFNPRRQGISVDDRELAFQLNRYTFTPGER